MTSPTIPVSQFADTLFTGVVIQLVPVLPYAGAVAAFVIGAGMLKKWLGHGKANALANGPVGYSHGRAIYRSGDKLYTSEDYR